MKKVLCSLLAFCLLLSGISVFAVTEIIIDDGKEGYQTVGDGQWTASQYGGSYNGGHMYVFDDTQTGGLYTPNIPETGKYAVYVHIPHVGPHNANMEAVINSRDGEDKVLYTQKTGEEGWLLLGAYSFEKGTDSTVFLHAASKPHTARMDAVKFVKVEDIPFTAEVRVAFENVEPNEELLVAFSSAFKKETIDSTNIKLSKNGVALPCEIIFLDEKNIKISYEGYFDLDSQYTISFTSSIMNQQGIKLSGAKEFIFKTQKEDLSFATAAAAVRDGSFLITYSKPANETAFSKDYYAVEKNGEFIPFHVQKGTNSIMLTPLIPMENAEYKIYINPAMTDFFDVPIIKNLLLTIRGEKSDYEIPSLQILSAGAQMEVISGYNIPGSGFSEAGNWMTSGSVTGYNNIPTRYVGKEGKPEEHFATFQPELADGKYKLSLHKLKNVGSCDQAKLEINGADGNITSLITINDVQENTWVDIGEVLWENGKSYVRIYKYEVDANLRLDVMKFTPVSIENEELTVNISSFSKEDFSKGFTVKFNHSIDFLNIAQITVTESSGQKADVSVIPKNRMELMVLPNKAFKLNEKYKITVPVSIKNAYGTGLKTQFVKEFETPSSFISPVVYEGEVAQGKTLKAKLIVENQGEVPLSYIMMTGTWGNDGVSLFKQIVFAIEKGQKQEIINEISPDTNSVFTFVVENADGSMNIPDSGWVNILNQKKGELIGKVFIPISKGQSLGFIDLDTVPWAQESINALMEKGVVSGTGGGNFSPNDYLTKEQFIKMLVGAFEIGSAKDSSDFKDVAKDQWYYEFISRAAAAGIVKGSADNTFGVGDRLSREDMATLLYRTAEAAGYKFTAIKEEVDFFDAVDINYYAVEAISVLQKAGIINGVSEDRFAPQDFTTRAMAARVIYGVLTMGGDMQ